MNAHDQVPDHVPDVVLHLTEVAITTYARNQPQQGIDDCDAPFLAEEIVKSLHRRGYLTWPGRALDRESLVLAVFTAIGWAVDDPNDDRTTAEVAVDALIPLIRQLTGTSPER